MFHKMLKYSKRVSDKNFKNVRIYLRFLKFLLINQIKIFCLTEQKKDYKYYNFETRQRESYVV